IEAFLIFVERQAIVSILVLAPLRLLVLLVRHGHNTESLQLPNLVEVDLVLGLRLRRRWRSRGRLDEPAPRELLPLLGNGAVDLVEELVVGVVAPAAS